MNVFTYRIVIDSRSSAQIAFLQNMFFFVIAGRKSSKSSSNDFTDIR